MNVVLDTNVLVSGLLTPLGPSGQIVRMVFSGNLTLFLDARILSEYREVLHRPKFCINKDHVENLLEFLIHFGRFVSGSPLTNRLPEPDDEPFLEVAFAANAKALVTGNSSHYPILSREDIKLFSPSEFIEFYRQWKGT